MNTRQKAALLRKAGFNVKFGLRGAPSTPQAKGAVTKAFARIKQYVTSGSHVFVPASRRARDSFSARQTRTPGGFFHPVPEGVHPARVKIRVRGKTLEQTLLPPQGKRGRGRPSPAGRGVPIRTDTVVRLDTMRVAKEGAAYVNALTEAFRKQNPDASFRLMVNGWNGLTSFTAKDLSKYLKFLIGELRSRGIGPTKANDIFHLRMIAQPAEAPGAPVWLNKPEDDEDEFPEENEENDEEVDEESEEVDEEVDEDDNFFG